MKKRYLFSLVALAIIIQASYSFAASDCYVEKLDIRYDYTWTSGDDYTLAIKVTDPSNGMGLDEEREDFNYRDLRWIQNFQIDNPSYTDIINLIIRKIRWHGFRLRLENLQEIEGDTKFEVFVYKGTDFVHYDSTIIPLTCELEVDEHRDLYFGNFRITMVEKS